jgi:hypothetical protein
MEETPYTTPYKNEYLKSDRVNPLTTEDEDPEVHKELIKKRRSKLAFGGSTELRDSKSLKDIILKSVKSIFDEPEVLEREQKVFSMNTCYVLFISIMVFVSANIVGT